MARGALVVTVDRLDQVTPLHVCVAVPMIWSRKTHRLFPSKRREFVLSMLLLFRREGCQLPDGAVLKIILPMTMDAAWVTPQEFWELEDNKNLKRKKPSEAGRDLLRHVLSM